eukprot:8079904-Lingulodinium_polyedra.AAC.1
MVETFSTMGTKVVQDAFHVERKQERRDQDNRVVTSSRKLWEPVQRAVLSQTHVFPEVLEELRIGAIRCRHHAQEGLHPDDCLQEH